MCGECGARFANRVDNGMAEFFAPEMLAHLLNNALPQIFAAFLVDRFVADDGKFVRAWRDKDQNGVTVRRFLHAEPIKFFLRRDQWVDTELASLNEHADLPGRF